MVKETKMHYKMYKDGKKWIFCGLSTMGLIVGLGVANVQVSADMVETSTVTTDKSTQEQTTDSTNESNEVSTESISVDTDATVQTNSKEVKTDSITEKDTNETIDSTSKVSSNASDNKEEKSNNNANKIETQSTTTNEKNIDVKTSDTKTTDIIDSTNEVTTSDDSDTTANQSTVNTVVNKTQPSEDVDSQTTSNEDTSNQNTATTKDDQNTDSTVIDNNIDSSTTTTSKNQIDDQDTLKNATKASDKTNKKDVDSQKRKDDSKKTSTKADEDIASGSFGSSDWHIDAEGTLHFGEGKFAKNYDELHSPWDKYSDSIKKISFDGKVVADESSPSLFNNLSNVKTIENIDNFDVSQVKDFSSMFNNCGSLTSLDLSSWNVSNALVMTNLFSGCTSLTDLKIANWDVSRVIAMDAMFDRCANLTSLDIANWKVDNVTSMGSMFSNCGSLSNLDVSQWNVSNVHHMAFMFRGDSALTSIDVSNWIVDNVTNMDSMFSGCTSLTGLDVSKWNVDNVANMASMFNGCRALANLDVSKWNVSKVINMEKMFYLCSSLPSINVSGWDVSNVTNMGGMFTNCNFTSIDVAGWNVSKVTDMNHMFSGCSKLTNIDVSNWNVSNVTNMQEIFGSCSKLTSIAVADWNVSSVTNMKDMFAGCSLLTDIDVSDWDVSSVTTMEEMFASCSALKSIDMSKWDVSNVTNMANLFAGCSALTRLDLSNFDMSSVENDESYAGMLTGLKNLKVLILGENTKIKAAGLSEPNFAGTSDRWVAVDGGSENDPQGTKYYTSAELMAAYASSMAGTYVIGADKSSIDADDSTIIAGPASQWRASDNVISALGIDGAPIDFSKVVVTGTVDTTTPGEYQVTYSYTDEVGKTVTDTITVHVVASKVNVNGHDSTFIAGPNSKWNAIDNFDTATDAEGKLIGFSDITVTGKVDLAVPGNYEITYSYTDPYGNTASKTVTVHVVASQVNIDVHDSTVVASPDNKWTPSDNFNSATDAEGNPVDLKDVTVSGSVDATKAGDYEVTYSYTDAYGNKVSKTITVLVIASQASVGAHDSTIIAGPNSKWTVSDNFDGATDTDGNVVDFKDVTVSGTVDPTKAGDYEVTYSYTDAYGNEVSKTVTVHVATSITSVDAHDSTIIAGPDSKWTASDNFDGATDAEGNTVDLKDVTVSGSVDSTKTGDYEVTYSYTDAYGNEVSKTITVHVVASQTSIDVHDSSVIAGPNNKWTASDNFDGAKDAQGNVVDLKDVTVSGNVDVTVPGNYEVTYSYTDAYGNVVSKTITVHVNATQVQVDGHDSTVIAGPNSKWTASDNFDGAKDADGNAVELKDVKVNGSVDLTKAGDYEVTYSYTDASGNTASKTVTVHVVATQASIDVHDSTIIAGSNNKWNPSDNFDGATDAEGNAVDLSDVTVDGKVDPQTPGDYDVTYSYTDAYGNKVSKTITVHIVASQANIDGHDSTIIAGPDSKWSSSDNFDEATDAEGNPIDFKDVAVSGEVNSQAQGDYEVTYSYIDASGNSISKTVTIHVVASQASIDVHDSTVSDTDSKWNPSDNFDGVTDAEGNPVDFEDVSVDGDVDQEVPGDYDVTYSYTDAYGNTVSKTITIHVVASQNPDTPDVPDCPNTPDIPNTSNTSDETTNSNTVDVPTRSEPSKTVKTGAHVTTVNTIAVQKQNTATNESKMNTLPQTDESKSNTTTNAGVLGLLAGILGMFGLSKRRRHGED